MENNGRILATATVDMIKTGPEPTWEVEVWGEAPFDRRRTYTLKAKTDNLAAQEGIELFVEEMECLRDAGLEGN